MKKFRDYNFHDPIDGVEFTRPYMRVSLLSSQQLSSSWQTVIFGGESSYNTNGLSDYNVNWNADENAFEFDHTGFRKTEYQIDLKFSTTALSFPADLQYRFLVKIKQNDVVSDLLAFPFADDYGSDGAFNEKRTFQFDLGKDVKESINFSGYAGKGSYQSAFHQLQLRIAHNTPLNFSFPTLTKCDLFLYQG